MKTLLHLSDLHFGAADLDIADQLKQLAWKLNPDIVVVSGDLTQRARKSQFIAARAFLNSLPAKQFIVPGNHDIPLFNLFKRLSNPFRNYREIIQSNLRPYYEDSDIVILGLSTPKRYLHSSGALSHGDEIWLKQKLQKVPKDITRILVVHHPPSTLNLGSFKVDLVLSGHTHSSKASQEASNSSIHIECGTSVSTRLRGETNSFNLLVLNGSNLDVSHYYWNESTQSFQAKMLRFSLHTSS